MSNKSGDAEPLDQEIERILKELVKKGFVEESVSETGEILYKITEEGQAAHRDYERTHFPSADEDLNLN